MENYTMFINDLIFIVKLAIFIAIFLNLIEFWLWAFDSESIVYNQYFKTLFYRVFYFTKSYCKYSFNEPILNILSFLLNISVSFLILFIGFVFFKYLPQGNKYNEIKKELIVKHEKEKCPYCIYSPKQIQYKFSEKTNKREFIEPVDFFWNSCPKLEKELKEKLTSKD